MARSSDHRWECGGEANGNKILLYFVSSFDRTLGRAVPHSAKSCNSQIVVAVVTDSAGGRARTENDQCQQNNRREIDNGPKHIGYLLEFKIEREN